MNIDLFLIIEKYLFNPIYFIDNLELIIWGTCVFCFTFKIYIYILNNNNICITVILFFIYVVLVKKLDMFMY